MTVYVSIGNSDDKLTQLEWAKFVTAVHEAVTDYATKVHGVWYSAPFGAFQNACWCFEVEPVGDSTRSSIHGDALKEALAVIADRFEQDSIAWAVVATTEFIKAPYGQFVS